MDMASIAGWCVLPLGALWQFLIIVAISFIIIIISMMNFIIISACHRRPLSTVPLTLGIQMAACLFMPLGDRLLCLLPALPCLLCCCSFSCSAVKTICLALKARGSNNV